MWQLSAGVAFVLFVGDCVALADRTPHAAIRSFKPVDRAVGVVHVSAREDHQLSCSSLPPVECKLAYGADVIVFEPVAIDAHELKKLRRCKLVNSVGKTTEVSFGFLQ